MKVWLDDIRETPEGWVRCYWPDEVIKLLKTDTVTELSLDHDLGDDDRGTGYDVLTWLEEQVIACNYGPPRVIKVHSANISARQKMEAAITQIFRFAETRPRSVESPPSLQDMTFHDVLRDGEIHIESSVWEQLKLDVEFSLLILNQAVEDGQAPYPILLPSFEEAMKDFQSLQNYDAESLIRDSTWNSPFPYGVERTRVIDVSRVGMKSSNFHHAISRHQCDVRGYPSPLRTWGNYKFRQGVFKALWSMNYPQVTSKEIRRAMEVRKALAAQFRPTAAKAVYRRYHATRVLDFCSGWGDRLSAALADSEIQSYVGIDPNHILHEGYAQQISMYSGLRDNPIQVSMRNECAEHAQVDGVWDLVFTSPPYFDKERYSRDPSQSWVKYKTVEGWLQGFLFPSVKMAWGGLVPGGHLAINIADIRSDRRLKGTNVRDIDRLCQPLREHVSTLEGSEFVEVLGLVIPGRPRKHHHRTTRMAEPIWVWRKDI